MSEGKHDQIWEGGILTELTEWTEFWGERQGSLNRINVKRIGEAEGV